MWDHSEETPDHQITICKYCGNDLVAKSTEGTTRLKCQLENWHNQPLTMGIRDEVRKFGWTNEKAWEIEMKKAILAEVPIAPSDCKKALSSLMGLIDMDKETCSYYEQEKEKLDKEFKDLTSRVCISFEIMEELNYISITAHVIKEDFNLVKKLIGFKKLTDTSSRSCVVHAIEKCISDWKLGDKIFSITGGEYSEYVSQNLKECLYFHVQSYIEEFARFYSKYIRHLISNKVKDTIYLILKRMKTCSHMDTFNQIAKERGLPPINKDWLNKYEEKDWYSFAFWDLDSVDLEHWEPALKIFKEAILYKDVFSQYAKINSGSTMKGVKGPPSMYELTQGRFGLQISSLSKYHWERMEAAVKLSDKLHEIIDRMASFNYPTSNLYFQYLAEIEDIIAIHYTAETSNYCLWDKIWNRLYFIACVFDPRYKLIFLKYYFEKRNRPGFTKNEDIDMIWEMLQKTFGAYAKGKTNEFANLQEEGCTSNSSHPSNPINDGFSKYIKELKKKTQKSELMEYLDDELVDLGEASFNLLGWWKQNTVRYPVLSRMARDYLAIPSCAYSIKGNICSDFRVLKGVSPQLLEAVICSKDWILSDILQSIPEPRELIDHGVAACCCCKNYSMKAAGGGGA